MSAITAIYSKLSTDTAVTSQVGSNIEPGLAAQSDAYPAVLIQEDSIEYSGGHAGSDGIATAVVKIDCEATTYTTATAVAAAVINSLNYEKGTWGGIVVQGSFVDDSTDDYEYTDNENLYFGVTVKATIIYQL
jgi:hypothetical protein